MKKCLVSIPLILIGVSCLAQVVRRADISVSMPIGTYIDICCYDSEAASIEKMTMQQKKDFALDKVTIIISSKHVTDTLRTGDSNNPMTLTDFRSAKLHFKVMRDGYKTLEQNYVLGSNCEYINIFLKKAKQH